MQAARPVTHFAAFDLDAFHRDGHSFMGGKLEILGLFFMTHGASFGTDVLGAFHLMFFQDFLDGFNVHFTARRKKEGTAQQQNGEDDLVTVHTPEIPG